MKRWWYGVGLLLCVCLFAGGCAKKTTKMVPVSGTVTLDGQPLDDGDVTLVGDPGTVPDSLPVKAGSFSGQAKPGKKRVEIRAFKTVKPPPTATGDVTETKENYIPAKYNTDSTTTAEVTDSGLSPNKFEVQSK